MSMRATLIGAGFIGRAWAVCFARAGMPVTLWARRQAGLDEAMTAIAATLQTLHAHGLLGNLTPQAALALITTETDLASALSAADYVQENGPENLDEKRTLFSTMDALAPPHAILASSTSAILPSILTEHLSGRHRCLVVHPINPPYLVPAVEIVPAPWTDMAVTDAARALMLKIGQAPIMMDREIDGFVMNRLQGALMHEAIRLVAGGFASVEDIDIGIREGLGRRWSFMGQFEIMDLNAPAGVRDYMQRYDGLYANLFRLMEEKPDWLGPAQAHIEQQRRAQLPEDALEKRRQWRDEQLAALAAHKLRP
jgi:L-gulonate 3-dehydrogenase